MNAKWHLNWRSLNRIWSIGQLIEFNQMDIWSIFIKETVNQVSSNKQLIIQVNIRWTDRREKGTIFELLYTSLKTSHHRSYCHTQTQYCETLDVYRKQQNIVICKTYRPPDGPDHISKFENCLTRIKEILSKLEHLLSDSLWITWTPLTLIGRKASCFHEWFTVNKYKWSPLWI